MKIYLIPIAYLLLYRTLICFLCLFHKICSLDAQQQKLIYDAMDDYHKYTCIRFKPYTGEENDYIRITAGNTGCWSSVGRIGGRQDVNLQVPGCVTKKGTVIHELMHAVGFLHEQSRYERDSYVYILWQNIMNGTFYLVNKIISNMWQFQV